MKKKMKMLSRNPFSAIGRATGNEMYMKTPDGISFRNWSKGLINRWGSIAKVNFKGEENLVILKWCRENNIEFSKNKITWDFYFSEENAALAACTLIGNTKEIIED